MKPRTESIIRTCLAIAGLLALAFFTAGLDGPGPRTQFDMAGAP